MKFVLRPPWAFAETLRLKDGPDGSVRTLTVWGLTPARLRASIARARAAGVGQA